MPTEFQDFMGESEGMVPESVDLCNHQLARGQEPQHSVRGQHRRQYAILLGVASFPCEAGEGELQESLVKELLVDAHQ